MFSQMGNNTWSCGITAGYTSLAPDIYSLLLYHTALYTSTLSGMLYQYKFQHFMRGGGGAEKQHLKVAKPLAASVSKVYYKSREKNPPFLQAKGESGSLITHFTWLLQILMKSLLMLLKPFTFQKTQ